MVKARNVYQCQSCGHQVSQWTGQCPQCHAWNTFVECATTSPQPQGYAAARQQLVYLNQIEIQPDARCSTHSSEFDRVLGGGLVAGSVILLGGDPGIGKSTLLLQVLAKLSQTMPVLYVSGEESSQQIATRAQRLQLDYQDLQLLTETRIETILQTAQTIKPKIIVIDSIQTIYTDALNASPGGVSQLRESTQLLVRHAKSTGQTLFIVGHVTKEGTVAGPKVLEHMVDTVLYFEGEKDSRFRIIRSIKNRYGAVNELGLFVMTDTGLKNLINPSAIFLSQSTEMLPGSVVLVTQEGSRAILVELQALVVKSHGQPRRLAVGIDGTRLNMLLAVLSRHAGIPCHDYDIFINVVGGVKIDETSSDTALILAILSSLYHQPLPAKTVCFGEIGLSGEIRPVPNGQQRLQEAEKHGMQQAIIPKANLNKSNTGIATQPVEKISDLVACFKTKQATPVV